ncbi:MAG: DUF4345 family protein [Candidatus Phaeomarinobacter sp.]
MSLIVLPYIAGIIGLGLGVFAIVSPQGAARLVGIKIDESLPHSVSEVRATYGGVFAGGHAFALATGSDAAFITLACGWGLTGLVRLVSIVIDRAANGANYGGTAFELAMAGLLVAPFVIT